jgi:hypothetical protein
MTYGMSIRLKTFLMLIQFGSFFLNFFFNELPILADILCEFASEGLRTPASKRNNVLKSQ